MAATVEPHFIIWTTVIQTFRLSRLVSLVPFFSWILIRCDLEKLKRLKVQSSFHTCVWNTVLILWFTLKKQEQHEINHYSDAFSWILIGSLVMLLRKLNVTLDSVLLYANITPINHKLKSQLCLRNESSLFSQ